MRFAATLRSETRIRGKWACTGIRSRTTGSSSIEEVERQVILATLERLGANKRRAAAALGISLKTLYSRLAVYRAQERARPADDPTE